MIKQVAYLLAAVFVIGLAGCADETFDPRLELSGTPALTSPQPGVTFTITEDNLEGDLIDLAWSALNTNVPTEVRYIVEADTMGGDFSSPLVLVASTTDREAVIRSRTLNSYLLNLGAAPGEARDLQVRVRGVVGLEADGNTAVSALSTISVVPFEAAVEIPTFFVPGAYQNWSPDADNVGRIYSVEDNGVYTGYVNFGDDGSEFKFTDAPNWDNGIYGLGAAEGELAQPGDNIVSAGSGYHLLTMNFNNLTYSQTPTSWGLIGNATPTGWDSDTDMTYDEDTGLLTITVALEGGTEDDGRFIKFRANDAWDINLGDNNVDGTLEQDGENIAISTTGTYVITLNLNDPVPTYSLELQ